VSQNKLLNRYPGIISLIQFFAETNRWGVVDRLATSMSPEGVETALYDMERLVRSLLPRRIKIRIKSREKTYELYCCEYGDKLGYGIYGEVSEVLEGPSSIKNEKIFCVPCPLIPSEEEVDDFLKEVRSNPSLARRLALIGLGTRGKGEEEEKRGE